MSEIIDPVEYVLRRIHQRYYDSRLVVPIEPEAFRPTDRDYNGISVFREQLSSAGQVIAAVAEHKRDLYYVARVTVRDLQTLGMTVVPDPQPDLPGHALIPELNWQSYQKDKKHWREVLFQLAQLASQAIVHVPTAP